MLELGQPFSKPRDKMLIPANAIFHQAEEETEKDGWKKWLQADELVVQNRVDILYLSDRLNGVIDALNEVHADLEDLYNRHLKLMKDVSDIIGERNYLKEKLAKSQKKYKYTNLIENDEN